MSYLTIARRSLASAPPVKQARERHEQLPMQPYQSLGPTEIPDTPGTPQANPVGEVIPTENQCGECLAWRLSMLVELGRDQRIYLCPTCLAAHRNRHPERRRVVPSPDGGPEA
jgi:hypothetical protein